MIYIILGLIAFVLFILYDVNSIIIRHKLLKCCFFAGMLLLIAATAGIIVTSWNLLKINIIRIISFGIPALFFFLLLIYTLFFAIPFKETYVQATGPVKLCKRGVYALCRHPGVLWFIGFYTFLGLALGIPLLFTAAAVFSVMNIFYVLFQDRWTFVKSFEKYDDYKSDTPFLIPNRTSLRKCFMKNRKIKLKEI